MPRKNQPQGEYIDVSEYKVVGAYAVVNSRGTIIRDMPNWPELRIVKLKGSAELSHPKDKVVPIKILIPKTKKK